MSINGSKIGCVRVIQISIFRKYKEISSNTHNDYHEPQWKNCKRKVSN